MTRHFSVVFVWDCLASRLQAPVIRPAVVKVPRPVGAWASGGTVRASPRPVAPGARAPMLVKPMVRAAPAGGHPAAVRPGAQPVYKSTRLTRSLSPQSFPRTAGWHEGRTPGSQTLQGFAGHWQDSTVQPCDWEREVFRVFRRFGQRCICKPQNTAPEA